MPSNPTRKTEVQAYRFELRRMNSALVRKDPVMLHDPLRTHSRATAVGVILGAIGLLGFLVFGILKPAQNPPEDGIVIGKDSGQVYVKTADPEMLIPTFNLASARLILLGQQAGAAEGDEQAPTEIAAPVIVPDERLNDIPRGRAQGIPGADIPLPSKDQQVSDNWAVCHHLPMDDQFNEEVRLEKALDAQQTAVLAGVPSLGQALKSSEAILVELRNGELQLIYRPEEDANRTAAMVRAQVPNDPSIMEALDIANAKRRPMSLGLLNSLQEVEPLQPPIPDNVGDPTNFDLGDRTANIGDVFEVRLPGNTDYYVVLEQGKQKVTQAVATMILHKNNSGETKIREVPAERLPSIRNAEEEFHLPVKNYPDRIPTVLDPIIHPTTCLGWTIKDDDERTTLYVGKKIPYPEGADGKKARPIKVSKANEDKIVLDYFYLPPGRAGVIHSATSKASFTSGVIQLVTDRGLRYGIPDKRTAAGLGLPEARPAPESIITLLPTGVSLNVQDAQRTFDSFEVPQGSGDYDGQDAAQQEEPG